jgi:hypothetical protein
MCESYDCLLNHVTKAMLAYFIFPIDCPGIWSDGTELFVPRCSSPFGEQWFTGGGDRKRNAIVRSTGCLMAVVGATLSQLLFRAYPTKTAATGILETYTAEHGNRRASNRRKGLWNEGGFRISKPRCRRF